MTKAEAIKYYRTAGRLAAAIGIGKASVSKWGEYPPIDRQCQIEVVTNGVLKAERSMLNTSRVETEASG